MEVIPLPTGVIDDLGLDLVDLSSRGYCVSDIRGAFKGLYLGDRS